MNSFRVNSRPLFPRNGEGSPTGGPRTTRILLSDSETLIREGTRRLIEGEADLQVIAEASSGDEMVRLAHQLQPEVIVFALNVVPGDDPDALRELLTTLNSARLLCLARNGGRYVDTLREVGVHGVISPGASSRDLITGIRTVAGGGMYYRLPERSAPVEEPTWWGDVLTPRELEVLRLVAEGLSNRDIAERLSISQRTVQFHLGRLFVKLGASSRTQAVHLARRRGWIE